MAEQAENKPKGARPGILILGGVVLLAAVIFRFYPVLFDGGQKPVTIAPASTQPAPAATAPPKESVAATSPEASTVVRAVTAADPLASFLVRFGRANPFAASTGGRSYGQPTAGSGSSIQDLRQRLQNLAGGAGQTQTGGSGQPGTGDGQKDGGFVLKGIVRLQDKVLVVITKDGKAYIAGLGAPLEKTGYTVKSIDGNKVTISHDDKDMVLVLGGKKP